MHQLRVKSSVIQHSSEVNNRSQGRDVSVLSQVLVTDDGLAHGFRLCHLGVQLILQQIERDDAALELEGEVRAVLILGDGADVVEKAGKVVCFWSILPVWEVLRSYRLACRGSAFITRSKGEVCGKRTVVVYSHAMIERLERKMVFRVLHHSLDYFALRELYIFDPYWLGFLWIGSASEEFVQRPGNRIPTVLVAVVDVLAGHHVLYCEINRYRLEIRADA